MTTDRFAIAAYTYRADVYEPNTILAAIRERTQVYRPEAILPTDPAEVERALDGLARSLGVDRDDEATFDSGDFPKVLTREQLDEYRNTSAYQWLEQEGDVDTLFDGYVTCALWASTDNADDTGGEPLDERYDRDDIAQESLEAMRADCDAFIQANAHDLLEYARLRPTSASYDASQGPAMAYAGHDFWLTRNRHGAGFWDRGLGELGDRLSEAAKVHGESTLIVGDDGKVHVL